jgi:hypothetical protein
MGEANCPGAGGMSIATIAVMLLITRQEEREINQ